MSNYAEYRAECTRAGAEFQDYVQETLHRELSLMIGLHTSQKYQYEHGESVSGVEIKFDEKSLETTNVYIEVAEKAQPRNGEYASAGIYANKRNWLYAIGNYAELRLFGTGFLRILHQAGRYKQVQIPTSIGFLIPRDDADKYALVIIRNGKRIY